MILTHNQVTWKPDSWKQFPVNQQPKYPDALALEAVLSQLRQQQALVQPDHVLFLKQRLAAIGRGEGFFIQGGDCAEAFSDSHEQSVFNKLRVLIQMAAFCTQGQRAAPLLIGRMAGQYFKPRSHQGDASDPHYLCPYRGDAINSLKALQAERIPQPERLLEAGENARIVLHQIEQLLRNNSAEFVGLGEALTFRSIDPAEVAVYRDLMNQTKIRTRELVERHYDQLQLGHGFFTSHEGLHLGYEQAFTRDGHTGAYGLNPALNLSAHFLWIGDRTRQLNHAHIEYFRGIGNAVGIKVGPGADLEEICDVIKTLNPSNEAGKITLICRFGAKSIEAKLPRLIELVELKGLSVVWSVDPMHGNAEFVESVGKTRMFDAILQELSSAFAIHDASGTYLGGVHLELTGENVTECLGGWENIEPQHLQQNYQTYCDPRLNYGQSLEMALVLKLLMTKYHDHVDFNWRYLHPGLSL